MSSHSSDSGPFHRPLDAVLVAIVFALMGAYFWAIRGTGGLGGTSGGILAGLGWAMLWLAFSHYNGGMRERPYGNGYMVAAITLGMGIGGATGYGVYIGWLDGHFYLNYPDGVRTVAPWTGYAMLFVCGLHWGGLTGALMAWCAPKEELAAWEWFARIGAGIVGMVLAQVFVVQFPQLFLPFYSEGIYAVEANATCIRAQESIQTIAPHVGLYFGFLLFEIIRRDFRAVAVMLIMGLGFALAFSIGGIWQTNNDTVPHIPWWKFWEMSIGFGGGLTFALVFYLFNRPEMYASSGAIVRERIAACAVIIILALTVITSDTFGGFSDLHTLNWPSSQRTVITILTLIGLIAAYVLWSHNRDPRMNDDDSIESILPSWTPHVVILFIVLAGLLLSVPGEIELANRILLGLYAGCITLSLIAIALLAWRKNNY